MEGLFKEGSLGSILFESRIITEEHIRVALDEQAKSGGRFGEALVKLGIVTQDDIDWALANQLNIPYVRLNKELVDKDAASKLSAETARKFNLVPIYCTGDDIGVAIADPLNTLAIEAVAIETGCHVTVSIGLLREIRELHDFLYGPLGEKNILGFQSDIFPPQVCEQVDADISGEKLLDCLLLYIIQGRLASLSLQPMGEYVAITARKGGSRREIGQMHLAHYPELLVRIRKLSRINGSPDISSRGVIAFSYKGERVPFQVALLRGVGGDYITFRIMVKDSFPESFAEMGLNESTIATLHEIASARKGLILWASLDHRELNSFIDMYLDEIETTGRQVLLVGNGLGRGKKRIPRIPVPAREQLDPAALIDAVTEHDPDLIVVEEITDIKTLAAALAAAMRNSLVIAGVSFEGMSELLGQILAMRQKHPFLVANLLGIGCIKGVLALCPECREQYVPTSRELEALGLSQAQESYYRPTGCNQCNYTGFERKRFLLELVALDETIRNKLGTVADREELLDFLDSAGYQDVVRQGEELLRRGEISPEEFSAALKA